MAKIQRRTITYTSKRTGKVKKYTYEYRVETTKVGGKTTTRFENITPLVRKRETLGFDEVKAYLDSKSATFEERQIILNEMKDGKTFTRNQLDYMLDRTGRVKSDKTINLLRNLGFTKEEIIKDMGISEEQFKRGKFKKIGNDIEFEVDGVTRYFLWDYDSGLKRKK